MGRLEHSRARGIISPVRYHSWPPAPSTPGTAWRGGGIKDDIIFPPPVAPLKEAEEGQVRESCLTGQGALEPGLEVGDDDEFGDVLRLPQLLLGQVELVGDTVRHPPGLVVRIRDSQGPEALDVAPQVEDHKPQELGIVVYFEAALAVEVQGPLDELLDPQRPCGQVQPDKVLLLQGLLHLKEPSLEPPEQFLPRVLGLANLCGDEPFATEL